MRETIPDWLFCWTCRALLGEVYSSIRAVAVGYNKSGSLLVRYYVDRPPKDDDYESLGVVVANILANTGPESEIISVEEEVVFSEEPLGKLEPLNGFVYARREECS